LFLKLKNWIAFIRLIVKMNFMNSYLIRKTPKGIQVVYADDTNIACHTLEDKSNVLFWKTVSTIFIFL